MTQLEKSWQDVRHRYALLHGASSSQKGAHVLGHFRLCVICWQACRDVTTCMGGGVRIWLRASCVARVTKHEPELWQSSAGRFFVVCAVRDGYRSLPRQSQLSSVHDWLRTGCRGAAGAKKRWRQRSNGTLVQLTDAELTCREARDAAEDGERARKHPPLLTGGMHQKGRHDQQEQKGRHDQQEQKADMTNKNKKADMTNKNKKADMTNKNKTADMTHGRPDLGSGRNERGRQMTRTNAGARDRGGEPGHRKHRGRLK